MQVVQDVVPANTRVPPDTHSAKNPNVNPGSPASAPPAVCFGTGSKGFLKIGDVYFVNSNGNAPATLVDAGSDAYFGLTLPDNFILEAATGCPGVYGWAGNAKTLSATFRVDCDTMELGSYWNGVKQACYSYQNGDGTFHVYCGNNLGSIYTCAQNAGKYGPIDSAFISWVPG